MALLKNIKLSTLVGAVSKLSKEDIGRIEKKLDKAELIIREVVRELEKLVNAHQ
jgi:hypothetical protein